jgi:NAD(P)-dependent dehydrogenase (short-subunit alcohol dehydrogenase family)
MEQLFQVNFFSAVRCSSKALALMRVQERGRIINISSVVAHKPSFGTSGYAATKSALEGYARGIAVDVANKGITANTIAYGYMEAGMLYDVPEPMLEEIKKTIPVGRFGDATQIGHTINYLINSPFTSGQTIHLNGGQWMP